MPTQYIAIIIGSVLVVLAGAVALWWLFGPGSRCHRVLSKAKRLIAEGNWREALTLLQALHQQPNLSPNWNDRLRQAMSECQNLSGREFLKEKKFEEALEALEKSSELGQKESTNARRLVASAMLEEIRYQFSITQTDQTDQVHQLIARTLLVQSPCPEATFWQALCFLREKKMEQAEVALQRIINDDGANGGESEKKIDPYLYLGTLILQRGDAREALRLLSEANRIDGNCPFVICQLARAMLASGGDVAFALRALQRVLGPKGFSIWSHAPHLVWIEGFPEGKSYVKALATKHHFTCPLWGTDYKQIQRQAKVAQGEGLFRLGQFEQSAEIFEQLTHESAPSVTVLRGLGLALVRLGHYDKAFKHLRTAHELENPKTYLTSGYLALCGAKAKPTSPEDKIHNINWAIWLVRDFSASGDEEFANLLNEIFAEARGAGIDIESSDQVHLCDHLVSVDATNTVATDAYHHLEMTSPEHVRLPYAWLYCRGVQLHDRHHDKATALFARVFQQPDDSREFFSSRDWSFDDLEFTFLERAATSQPGQFPGVLGADYPRRGAALLLERAQELEAKSEFAEALAAVEILIRLAPGNARAFDYCARLHYRQGNVEQAINILNQWRNADAGAWQPLLRLAVLHHHQGEIQPAKECIDKALDIAPPEHRADIAYLSARLLLRNAAKSHIGDDSLGNMEEIAFRLDQCFQFNPHHAQAIWLRAALAGIQGDNATMARFAAALADATGDDEPRRLLAAVCSLAAADHSKIKDIGERIAAESAENGEMQYLFAWSALDSGDPAEAQRNLTATAEGAKSPSQVHARGLLGALCYFHGDFQETARQWLRVPTENRAAWGLDEPLARVVFVTALQAFAGERYADAAEKMRHAGRLGLREPRLGALLNLALLKAGQQMLYQA